MLIPFVVLIFVDASENGHPEAAVSYALSQLQVLTVVTPPASRFEYFLSWETACLVSTGLGSLTSAESGFSDLAGIWGWGDADTAESGPVKAASCVQRHGHAVGTPGPPSRTRGSRRTPSFRDTRGPIVEATS